MLKNNLEYTIGLFRNLTILEDLTYDKQNNEFCTLGKAWDYCLNRVFEGYSPDDALDITCDNYDLSFRHYEAIANLAIILEAAMEKFCQFKGGNHE